MFPQSKFGDKRDLNITCGPSGPISPVGPCTPGSPLCPARPGKPGGPWEPGLPFKQIQQFKMSNKIYGNIWFLCLNIRAIVEFNY